MKKKTLSILLTVAMMFSLISLPQAAAEGETAVRHSGDYTFEFTDVSEITGGSRNVTVQGGKLIKSINETAWACNLKAILNYKLESNKTYAYEVVGTLDNYTAGQIYPYLATATETDVKTTLVNMYQTGNGWYAPKNGDIKYYGKFATGELTDDDYLAFYINDGTVGSEFKFDKVKIFEVRSGDQTFNFDNDYDVFRTVNANADTEKGILALNNNTGADAELSATLNYQLKSNTAYSVEISFYVEGESTPNWITPKLYTSNPFTGNAVKEVASIDGFGATPGSGVIKYYNKKISFTTGEISESENLLRFYMWVGKSYTYTYNINSIKIYDETEYPVNTGDYTFDFDVRKKDTVNVTNGYVADGKLVTKDGKAAWNNLSAILNYKLESNRTYKYEIVGDISGYTAGSVQAFLTLASKIAADTAESGKIINLYYPTDISGWKVPTNGNITLAGKFNTADLIDENNYLALYLNDGTDAKFEFEYIKITDITTNTGNYSFAFDEKDKDTLVVTNGDVKDGKLVTKDGKAAWDNLSAILNYKLQSNKTYRYEIVGDISGYTAGSVQALLTLASKTAADTAESGKIINLYYPTDISGWKVPTNGNITLAGKFNTADLIDENNYLALYLNDGTDAKFEFEYIKITDITTNTGNYSFAFDEKDKDTLVVTNGDVKDGKLVTKDGKAAWDNLSAILNYKLQSNKTYRYEIVGDISGYTAGSVQALLTLASKTAADTAESGKIINLYYPTVISGWKVPTNGSFTLAGKFNTADLTDENNYLALYLNDGTDAKFEFDTIEIIEMNETAAPSNELEVTSATSRKIILNSIEGCEYSYNGKVWQDSPVMTGYGTGEITFYARFKETKYNFASEPIIVKYTVHKLGDVNGDGEIAASDLSALRKYLLGISVYASPTGSDVNEDDVLDIRDLVRLKNQLVAAPASLTIGNAEYTLDYSEEFFGTKLSSRWKNVTSYEKKINEKRSLVDNINNSVSNGVLSIGSSLDETGVYHGGEIASADKFSHGYFEAKIKIPAGTGYFPAFWGKMPAFLSDKPYQNEIDFFEFFGTDREFYPGIHTWFDPNAQNLPNWIVNRDKKLTMVNDTEFVFALPYASYELSDSNIYHTYGCEWTSEKLAFYLDGNLLVEKKFDGDYSDYYTALREGDPIYIYLSNLVGYENTLPENIGYSLDVEYFRYYKPANS